MLRDTLNQHLKDGLKAQDKRRVATLRLVLAALKDRDIEARGAGKEQLTDDEILGLLQKMVKQRQESLKIYEEAGRADLATQEREEIEIIMGFMPKQMSADEAAAAIKAVVGETGAAGLKDMGKVMAVLKERFAGKMDFGKASGLVKDALK
jgi:uncharacterized protein YqeY